MMIFYIDKQLKNSKKFDLDIKIIFLMGQPNN